MAITLRHDVVGFGAKGDNGSQRKFGQNLVLQQQQMTQENMQRAQDRVFELGKMDIANRNQRLRDNRMVQADKDMAAIRLKAENDRFVQGRKFQQQDMEAQNQQNWLMGNTRNLEAQVGDLRGRMAQNQYTPEGQKLYGDLAGALRAIESQRDGIRPKEYNKLLSDWLNNAERSGLEKFVAPAPTVKTEMEGRFHDLGNGNALILQPDGEMRVQKLEKQEDQSDPRVYFNDKATYSSARKQAESSLAQRFEKNNPTAESVPDFSAEDIHAEMLREFDDHQGLLKKLSPQAQPDAGMPASPSSPPMEPAPVQPVAPPQIIPPPATIQPHNPNTPPPAAAKKSDERLAKEWAWSVYVGAASMDRVPEKFKAKASEYLANPTVEWEIGRVNLIHGAGKSPPPDGLPAHPQPVVPPPATTPPSAPQNPPPEKLQPYDPNTPPPPETLAQAPGAAGQPPVSDLSRTARENFKRKLDGMYSGNRDQDGRVSGSTMEDLKRALENQGGTPNGEVDARMSQLLSPEAVQEMAKSGAENPEQALIDYWVNYMTPSMPKQATPVKVNEIKDPITRTQAVMKPRVGSPADMADMIKSGKLKPGDEFITPDGALQRYTPPSK